MKHTSFSTIAFAGHSEIDLCTPTYWNVSLADFFAQLGLINRWPGNLAFPYSALHHALLVAETIEQPHQKIYGLLHSTADAVLGGISGPAKLLIDNLTGHELNALRQKHLAALCASLNIQEPSFAAQNDVARANQRVYATELRDVVLQRGNLTARFKPLPQIITRKERGQLLIQALDAYHVYHDMHQAHIGGSHHG